MGNGFIWINECNRSGWRDRASAAQQVLPMGKTPPLYTTADAHLGGGFSEEGMRLSRKGISVTLLPLLHDTGVAHFNTIIAADIITAVPAGKPRKKIYNNLATHLDAGGKLLVSCSGHAATTAEPLTAKIGKLFAFLSGRSAGYYMPFTGNYFTDGRIVKYALSLPQATAELQRAGFSVEQQAQQGHSWALLAVKII